MQLSNLPTWIAQIFASGASGSYVRTVPATTTDPAAASHTLGFPPQTFTAEGAGGTPPDGRDFNGILQYLAAWANWQGAGGTVPFNSAVATAGGYPKGAVVQSSVTAGLLWISTVDNNTTNPDSGGAANWLVSGGATKGSNAVGSWVKTPDGLLRQRGRVSIPNGSNTETGTFAFPQSFIAATDVSLTGNSSARANPSWAPSTIMLQTTDGVNCSWIADTSSPTTVPFSNSIYFTWEATGRWY